MLFRGRTPLQDRFKDIRLTDLYVGILVMIAVSALFFAFTIIVASRFSDQVADWMAVGAMVLLILYIYFLWDQAEVTWFVPYPNAIILGNWFPVITAILSALVYHRVPGKFIRKYGTVALLNLVGCYALIQPILGETPKCENQFDRYGVARQTTQVTCSPTSAVNLLSFYDIDTSESEMAELCLTRQERRWLGISFAQGGTSWMGLYRGLKIKLQDTVFEPKFFSLNYDSFMANPRGPLIMSLSLRPELEVEDPELFIDLTMGGWQPGIEHNVVFSEILPHSVSLIIDPKIGIEEMPFYEFQELFVGRGIYVSKRP